MIIACENCQTRFKVGDDKLANGPIRVRCSKCSHVFMASNASGVGGGPATTLPPSALGSLPPTGAPPANPLVAGSPGPVTGLFSAFNVPGGAGPPAPTSAPVGAANAFSSPGNRSGIFRAPTGQMAAVNPASLPPLAAGPNPLSQPPSAALPPTEVMRRSNTEGDPFRGLDSLGRLPTPGPTPLPRTTTDPFTARPPSQAAPSPFGAPPPSPFGAPAPSPFGASSPPAPSPFGASSPPAPSPFAAPSQPPSQPPSPSPFGAPARSPSSASLPAAFGGAPAPAGGDPFAAFGVPQTASKAADPFAGFAVPEASSAPDPFAAAASAASSAPDPFAVGGGAADPFSGVAGVAAPGGNIGLDVGDDGSVNLDGDPGLEMTSSPAPSPFGAAAGSEPDPFGALDGDLSAPNPDETGFGDVGGDPPAPTPRAASKPPAPAKAPGAAPRGDSKGWASPPPTTGADMQKLRRMEATQRVKELAWAAAQGLLFVVFVVVAVVLGRGGRVDDLVRGHFRAAFGGTEVTGDLDVRDAVVARRTLPSGIDVVIVTGTVVNTTDASVPGALVEVHFGDKTGSGWGWSTLNGIDVDSVGDAPGTGPLSSRPPQSASLAPGDHAPFVVVMPAPQEGARASFAARAMVPPTTAAVVEPAPTAVPTTPAVPGPAAGTPPKGAGAPAIVKGAPVKGALVPVKGALVPVKGAAPPLKGAALKPAAPKTGALKAPVTAKPPAGTH